MMIIKTIKYNQNELENLCNKIICDAVKYNYSITNNYNLDNYISVVDNYISSDLTYVTQTKYIIYFNDEGQVENIIYTNTNNHNNKYDYTKIEYCI